MYCAMTCLLAANWVLVQLHPKEGLVLLTNHSRYIPHKQWPKPPTSSNGLTIVEYAFRIGHTWYHLRTRIGCRLTAHHWRHPGLAQQFNQASDLWCNVLPATHHFHGRSHAQLVNQQLGHTAERVTSTINCCLSSPTTPTILDHQTAIHNWLMHRLALQPLATICKPTSHGP